MQEPPRKKADALETYNTVAETIAGPSLRWKDNLFQGLFVIGGLVVGIGIGALIAYPIGAYIGGVIGLVGATLTSGIVLMVLGWIRAAKKL